jgi:hypothetical protein
MSLNKYLLYLILFMKDKNKTFEKDVKRMYEICDFWKTVLMKKENPHNLSKTKEKKNKKEKKSSWKKQVQNNKE